MESVHLLDPLAPEANSCDCVLLAVTEVSLLESVAREEHAAETCCIYCASRKKKAEHTYTRGRLQSVKINSCIVFLSPK